MFPMKMWKILGTMKMLKNQMMLKKKKTTKTKKMMKMIRKMETLRTKAMMKNLKMMLKNHKNLKATGINRNKNRIKKYKDQKSLLKINPNRSITVGQMMKVRML